MSRVTEENYREHQQTHDKENSWWMNDARGIPLCRVCESCERVARGRYRPEVLGDYGSYEDVVSEPIEPEDY